MRRFKKVTIIGPGLIGGSIGMALKKRRLAEEVVGVFRRRSSLKKALEKGAVDRGTLNLEQGVRGSDIVIVATGVRTIPTLALEAAKFMKRGSVLTDVGSVKAGIVKRIESKLPGGIAFIGAHPMAGSERSGVEFADPEILNGAAVIISETASTNKTAASTISRLWRSMGSRVMVRDPRTHDKDVSMISHLPHAAAVALCLAQSDETLSLAAGSFRDMTRIASSDPKIWIDIFKANKNNIMAALDEFIKELKRIKKDLSGNNFASLESRMKRAKAIREKCRRLKNMSSSL